MKRTKVFQYLQRNVCAVDKYLYNVMQACFIKTVNLRITITLFSY